MLIRRERDLEMDRNPLRHLLPNQNCKNLWNNIPDTCTYSTNVVLRAPGGAWDSDLPEGHSTPQAVAQVNEAPAFIAAERCLKGGSLFGKRGREWTLKALFAKHFPLDWESEVSLPSNAAGAIMGEITLDVMRRYLSQKHGLFVIITIPYTSHSGALSLLRKNNWIHVFLKISTF